MLTAALASVLLGRQMYGDHDRQVREDIQSAYDGYARAVVNRDVDGTMAYLTPDIVWIYPNGKEQHGSEIRKSLEAWEHSIPAGTKIRFTIERIQIDSDDQAEAFVTLHSISREDAKAKKPDHQSHWHDTWVRSHGRWLNIRGVELPTNKAQL